jgi:ABC-type methionine transport system permease subunit
MCSYIAAVLDAAVFIMQLCILIPLSSILYGAHIGLPCIASILTLPLSPQCCCHRNAAVLILLYGRAVSTVHQCLTLQM